MQSTYSGAKTTPAPICRIKRLSRSRIWEEVLEYLGRQGDYIAFFAQFSEFWRILKPNGLLIATVPALRSEWFWGDPGHTRAITSGNLVFLSQKQYAAQIGMTAMSDYRRVYKADFDVIAQNDNVMAFSFVLMAVKEASV